MSGKEAVREPVSDLLLYLFTDNVLYLVIWEGSSALMAITLVLFTSENLRFCLPVVILFIFILALSKRSITPCIYPMIVLLVSFFLWDLIFVFVEFLDSCFDFLIFIPWSSALVLVFLAPSLFPSLFVSARAPLISCVSFFMPSCLVLVSVFFPFGHFLFYFNNLIIVFFCVMFWVSLPNILFFI